MIPNWSRNYSAGSHNSSIDGGGSDSGGLGDNAATRTTEGQRVNLSKMMVAMMTMMTGWVQSTLAVPQPTMKRQSR